MGVSCHYAHLAASTSTMDHVHNSYARMAQSILETWAKNSDSCEKGSAQLDMVSKACRLVEAYLLLGWQSDDFEGWVERVYQPAAEAIAGRRNNWGAWGLYGRALAEQALDSIDGSLKDDMRKWLKTAISHMPVISRSNELWRENLRHNSWLWYTYHSLAPWCRAAQLVDSELIRDALPALKTFWRNCTDSGIHKRGFPYAKLPGPLGWAQNLVWPGASSLEQPESGAWPWSMFEGVLADVAYYEHDTAEAWNAVLSPMRPIMWGNVFSFPTFSLAVVK